MGKTHKSKPQCFACLSLRATLGSQTAHWKQTLGQMELFILLYILFDWCMSLSDGETICSVTWWITNFTRHSTQTVWHIFRFGIFYFTFLRSTKMKNPPIFLLIIPLGLWTGHRWTFCWPIHDVRIIMNCFYRYFLHSRTRTENFLLAPILCHSMFIFQKVLLEYLWESSRWLGFELVNRGCERPPCWFKRLMAELWHKS